MTFQVGIDRHNNILMSLLLQVAEKKILKKYQMKNEKYHMIVASYQLVYH